jgi:uncharacterized Ntn-hydrolase superfamily protein
MYQLKTLWWRAHAHATNSSVLAVATITPAATMASANVATERITSVRFGKSLPFITFLLLSHLSADGSFPAP